MKLNGTHQLLAYADDVNILGGSIHTVKENAESLVVATKEKNEMGGACGTYGGRERCAPGFGGET